MKELCSIYKSLTRSDYYLFVKQHEDLSRVPDSLLEHFGLATIAFEEGNAGPLAVTIRPGATK
jgi:uncharacterized protein YcgL (UPF0745 family)